MPESPTKNIETSKKTIETTEKPIDKSDTKPQTIQISNGGCVCNTGIWCVECLGEYDDFLD